MEIEEELKNKSEGEEKREEGLSKAELRKIEAEKRVKRIHELMELIEKSNEELQKYQSELMEVLKVHITIPQIRPRRERKAKDMDDSEKEDGGSGGGSSTGNVRREREPSIIDKKPNSFNKFFFTPVVEEVKPIEVVTPTPTPLLAKRRARAVSYDETDKKSRLENFEIVDIFQLKNVDVDFVRECLEKCDVTGDIKLFRRIFTTNIPKDKQILRFLGGKNYQTKRNGLWIDDLNASYMKHVIKKIFEQSYILVNDLEHYGENIDRFLMNQEHINSFNDDKYIEKLMAQITNIIDIKVGDK